MRDQLVAETTTYKSSSSSSIGSTARSGLLHVEQCASIFSYLSPTFKSHNKYARRKCMPSAGFEPAIPVIQRPQTYVIDCTANGIDHDDLIAFLFFPFSGRIVNLKKKNSIHKEYTTNSILYQKTQFTAALCQRGFVCYWNFISGISLLQLKPYYYTLLHIATHCYILLHIATYCYIFLYIATYYYTLLHIATYCYALLHIATYYYTLLHIATYCYTLLHIATYFYILLHITTHCYTLLHVATHCYILPHIAIYCYILLHISHCARPQSRMYARLHVRLCNSYSGNSTHFSLVVPTA